MAKNKLISIVIPIFNAENYLEKCVAAVEQQTYENLEIILINDGSTDTSQSIMEQLAAADSRIKTIHKENEGVSATRNLGIRLAQGEYIMFVDNDDFILPKYVQTYMEEIEKSQLDIVLGGYQRINSHGTVLFSDYPRDNRWGKYVILAPWAKIYRLSFLRKHALNFLDYPIGEDVYFNLQAFSCTDKIKAICNLDYQWFYNGDSISNTSQKGFSKEIDILDFLNHLLTIKNHQSEYFKYFIRRYTIWFLLFSGRHATPQEFIAEHQRIQRWVKEQRLENKLLPFSKKLAGEGYKNRFITFVFMLIEKCHAIPLFAKLYCRGS